MGGKKGEGEGGLGEGKRGRGGVRRREKYSLLHPPTPLQSAPPPPLNNPDTINLSHPALCAYISTLPLPPPPRVIHNYDEKTN